jgi:hypothetical protein
MAKAMSVAAGMAQPRAGRDGLARGEIDERRGGHARERGQHRQAPPPRIGQRAVDDLALDFETHDEEEQRHQPVVDPRVQRAEPGTGVNGRAAWNSPCQPCCSGELASAMASAAHATSSRPGVASWRRTRRRAVGLR